MMQVFSIFDSKAQGYLRPFFETNRATAIRTVIQALEDEQSQFCKFAEDYTLFHLGAWDDQAGVFHMNEAAESLGGLHTYKAEG